MSDEDNDFMNEPEQMDDVHTTQKYSNHFSHILKIYFHDNSQTSQIC